MNNFVKSFVSDKFPDFVVAGHDKFKLFVEAYYEWLEQQNTGTATSVRNLFNELPNPAGLVVNADLHKDIDETLDAFVEYFRRDVLPIAIDDSSVNGRLSIKKIRDLYLSKGSPKSYKLFFRILFDEEVEITETKNNVLRSSDGSYLSFPTAIFKTTGTGSLPSEIDFSFATITDSELFVDGIIISALEIGEDNEGNSLIRAIFAEKYPLELKTVYRITDPTDTNIFIEVEPLPILDEFTLKKGGALNQVNDSIFIESKELSNRYIGKITSVGAGSVDNLVIRDRGILYNVGDKISFRSTIPGAGGGGEMFVTSTDANGRVGAIDGVSLRTGASNNGFLASELVDVKIPVSSGGKWTSLPQVEVTTNSVEHGLPYNNTTHGLGLQAVATSQSIGEARGLFFSPKPYFINDSDDFDLIPLTQVVLQNINGIDVGKVVSFQMFESNYPAVRDDSERFVIKIVATKRLFKPFGKSVKLPVGFDSETFSWIPYEYQLDSELGVMNTSGSTLAFRTAVLNQIANYSDITSATLDVVVDSEIIFDGGYDYDGTGSTSNLPLDGGALGTTSSIYVGSSFENSYDYNLVSTQTYTLNVDKVSPFLDQVDSVIIGYAASLNPEDSEFHTKYFDNRTPLPETIPEDSGRWVNTNYYGIVTRIRHGENIVTLSAAPGLNYSRDDSEINNLATEKYELLRLSTNFEADSESVNLPLTNIVAQVSQPSFNYTLKAITETSKNFVNERGFLSSASMVLQDNNYYSTFTYIITTKTPINEWKEKVKLLLHPAGTKMFANLFVEQKVAKEFSTTASTSIQKPNKNSMTFDTSLEHYDPNFKIEGVFADNVTYSANSYELVTQDAPLGSVLRASTYYENSQKAFNYEKGDAFWDVEPLGLVADWTTQSSNGTDWINSEIKKYAPTKFEHLVDNSGNVLTVSNRLMNPSNSTVNYTVVGSNVYSSYDSDDFNLLSNEDKNIIRFSRYDSDNGRTPFKSFNYRPLKALGLVDSNGDLKAFKTVITERKKEIQFNFEKDVNTCLVDPASLKYEINSTVFTGFDALEKKWSVSSVYNRQLNYNGWEIIGWSSKVQNASNNRERSRQYEHLLEKTTNFTPVETFYKSYTSSDIDLDSEQGGNWWLVNDTYKTKINTFTAVDVSVSLQEPVIDTQTLMKNRRGS
jgi:hypothetical protein